MSTSQSALGVLDWGIGGLDVVAKLRRAGVQRPVLYVSDAGACPYGKQSDAALTARVGALLGAFVEHGCDEVVIGCNAASTVLDAVPRHGLRRVLGVIEPGIAATLASGEPEVVVLGGARTIASGLYGRALRPHGVAVREVVAQPLSALVERGVLAGPELDSTIARIVAEVTDTAAIVSACTHYVAALPALRRALPRLRTVIDPAAALAEQHFEPGGTPGPDRFWTTGDPDASTRAAARAFGVHAPFRAAGDQLPSF